MPETGTFLSRDPWSGNISRPNTLTGYSYAANNPIIYKDASGLDYLPWLDRYTCDDPLASSGYVYQYDQTTGTWGLWPCIVDPNNVQTGGPFPSIPPTNPSSPALSPTDPNLWMPAGPNPVSPVNPLKTGITGYVEGSVTEVTTLLCKTYLSGLEVVYDFQSRERALFEYGPVNELGFKIGMAGVSTDIIGVTVARYSGLIWGFDDINPGGLNRQYSGVSWTFDATIALSLFTKFKPQGIDIGKYLSTGANITSSADPDTHEPNFDVVALIVPFGVSGSKAGLPFLSAGQGWTRGSMVRESYQLYTNKQAMYLDVGSGKYSPVSLQTGDGLPTFREMIAHGIAGQ